MEITIAEPVRLSLRAHLVDEEDLLAATAQAVVALHPGAEEHLELSCEVAVRRPADPETAELRRLDVSLKRVGDGWRIIAVGSFEPDPGETA